MMKVVALLLCLVAAAQAFVAAPAARLSVVSASSRLANARSGVARVQKSQLRMAEASGYWEGEWVCADCGYIYDRDDCGGLYFEQQKKGFVCPQCRGPRRRFAKKVGDKVGITQDGGDAGILLFSFLGFAATVAFGFWFSQQ
ncbi:hypothetical protein JKP88DRAFT_222537 [Tribonema minus]|uniref:Rubredoxin-like domain-containing protein n=1 Tax=Tribonema minus TaxID=303371 RepID=A0A836CCB5_9STRA|nr:hypothetical protein JKP88DRAFT_222537 [Tribonema minus]